MICYYKIIKNCLIWYFSSFLLFIIIVFYKYYKYSSSWGKCVLGAAILTRKTQNFHIYHFLKYFIIISILKCLISLGSELSFIHSLIHLLPSPRAELQGGIKPRACVLSHFSQVQVFVTLWTADHQVLLSIGFSRREYWSRLPFPPPGIFPNPGIEPVVPALAGGFFTTRTIWETTIKAYRALQIDCFYFSNNQM